MLQTIRLNKVTIPAPTPQAPLAEIRIDRNGKISLSGQSMSREKLGLVLRERMKATEPDPMVLVGTDNLLSSGESKSVRAFIQDLGCRPVEH